ncbi:Glutamate dehydrogenase [Actinidia chinensis var. chinensis]|uniref:Glutamate dehydrogenase n=1 Tax=Actinidia chinensis var. chinensis TaxID=1590841 RepID=A0A2R6QFG6_ACTCC|nr:Glutamate dehydrogenase [Actinidia chinensis var. chinensis]
MLLPVGGLGMNSTMDDINLLQQAQRHHLVVRELGEEIDLEIGPGDDDPTFANTPLISGPSREPSAEEHDDSKHMVMVSQLSGEDHDLLKMQPLKRKKKVVKRWREEWADTYKWAYVDVKEGTARIFCSVCREYGRKHRRNPYGNEGSRNMQMSALEEHNNSLLHKEALRLQMASNDKVIVDKPIYVKALMSKTAGTIVEAAVKRDPQEFEFIQCVQEAVHALERVIAKNSHYVNMMERLLEPERMIIFRVPWVDDRGEAHGSFTGPRIIWSGSSLRTEATGYGLVFFAQLILADMNKELKGLRCIVSGSGKIAMHVLEKLLAFGAIPITVSDSKGYLVDEDGFDYMKVSFLRDLKTQHRSLRDYSKTYARAKYYDEAKPWNERCDVAFPCASQNEIDQSDAINLVNSGCRLLVEGSNMPCTSEAVDVLRKANVLIAPAIAAGAGGVAAGELELLNWSPEEFESKLQEAMKQTYQRTLKAATDFGYQKESPEALVHGATISAFLTTANGMSDQGCV